jgi:arylsulfatase A-like enzyme
LDIYPTLCELLNLEPKPWLRGKSLLPLVKGETEALHDEIFAEQTYHGRLEPLRCIRTERYKYIRRHFPTGPIMPHDGPSTAVMEAAGHYNRETGREELYDLYLDPMEACNRVDSAEYREIHDDLSRRLDRWLKETGDPFPSGQFPPIPAS